LIGRRNGNKWPERVDRLWLFPKLSRFSCETKLEAYYGIGTRSGRGNKTDMHLFSLSSFIGWRKLLIAEYTFLRLLAKSRMG
jgi:hypothetical protein